jgi:hypothetical protein
LAALAYSIAEASAAILPNFGALSLPNRFFPWLAWMPIAKPASTITNPT